MSMEDEGSIQAVSGPRTVQRVGSGDGNALNECQLVTFESTRCSKWKALVEPFQVECLKCAPERPKSTTMPLAFESRVVCH